MQISAEKAPNFLRQTFSFLAIYEISGFKILACSL
jgi:hypothetical protein